MAVLPLEGELLPWGALVMKRAKERKVRSACLMFYAPQARVSVPCQLCAWASALVADSFGEVLARAEAYAVLLRDGHLLF
jgi:hypothetical protein